MLVDFLIFGCFAGSTSGSLVTSLLLPFTALNISSKPYASVAVTHRGGVTVGLGLGRIERAQTQMMVEEIHGEDDAARANSIGV
ncbi:hypothetical protein V6N13_043544 [Hibiscus sabdariffa]